MPARYLRFFLGLAAIAAAVGMAFGALSAVLDPGPPPIPTTDHGTGTR